MAERLTLEDAITHAKEVAERNRKQYKNCPSDRTDISHQTCEECAEEHEQLATWLAELKRYKDLEEQGRLIELPCAVGDTVYCIYNDIVIQGTVRLIRPFISEEKIIFKGNIICEFDKEEIEIFVVFINPYGFERVAYLTKEEAEAKLKELRGEEE